MTSFLYGCGNSTISNASDYDYKWGLNNFVLDKKIKEKIENSVKCKDTLRDIKEKFYSATIQDSEELLKLRESLNLLYKTPKYFIQYLQREHYISKNIAKNAIDEINKRESSLTDLIKACNNDDK